LKNYDLLLKIAIDLIDTLKYKLSDISPNEHFSYVSKVNNLLTDAKTSAGKADSSLISSLTYNHAKLNLAFALIISSNHDEIDFNQLSMLFTKSIKQLRSLKQDDEVCLDLAAANYHRGTFLSRHL